MSSKYKSLLKELEPFYFKIESKTVVSNFKGNIYGFKTTSCYELISKIYYPELKILFYETPEGSYLSEIKFSDKWNIMSYDKRSLQKTFEINKQIEKIMKILKKYTFIKNEKKLLLAELKKIADRKNEPNRHKISSNRSN